MDYLLSLIGYLTGYDLKIFQQKPQYLASYITVTKFNIDLYMCRSRIVIINHQHLNTLEKLTKMFPLQVQRTGENWNWEVTSGLWCLLIDQGICQYVSYAILLNSKATCILSYRSTDLTMDSMLFMLWADAPLNPPRGSDPEPKHLLLWQCVVSNPRTYRIKSLALMTHWDLQNPKLLQQLNTIASQIRHVQLSREKTLSAETKHSSIDSCLRYQPPLVLHD